MKEFDKKLNIELHRYKGETRKTFMDIADESGVPIKHLYRFTSEVQALNSENTKKLMDYLNLTVNLEKK